MNIQNHLVIRYKKEKTFLHSSLFSYPRANQIVKVFEMLARQSFSESYKVLQMDMYDMCDNLPLFKATISPGSARSICHSATSWAGARPVVEQ